MLTYPYTLVTRFMRNISTVNRLIIIVIPCLVLILLIVSTTASAQRKKLTDKAALNR
jgi:hypothetical protein